MKNKKILIGVLALLLLAAILYWRFKAKQNETGPGTNSQEPDPFPLKFGSRGVEVEQLQKYLIRKYGAKISIPGTVDGIWGNMTEEAVQKFLNRDNVSKALYVKFGIEAY